MPNDALRIYLHDHLAGSAFAIEVLETLSHQHAGEPLAQFADSLRIEIEQDRDTLQGIASRVGQSAPRVKELVARLGEKLSQFKLRHDAAGPFGTFEALEAL